MTLTHMASFSLESLPKAVHLHSCKTETHASLVAPPLACRPGRRTRQSRLWNAWKLQTAEVTQSNCASLCNRRPRSWSLLILNSTKDQNGNIEDNFTDVDKHIVDYFTFKAVEVVLQQLHELDPSRYMWFYQYVTQNNPNGKKFIQRLVQERQELGERVMVTRLHLFKKWAKRYSHEHMYKTIQAQNLELLRERLMESVKFMPEEGDVDQPPLRS